VALTTPVWVNEAAEDAPERVMIKAVVAQAVRIERVFIVSSLWRVLQLHLLGRLDRRRRRSSSHARGGTSA